jgi:DNA-binding response OmpR family regulator
MDGFTAYGELRRNPTTSNVPVIFLTAKPQTTADAQCLIASAHGYIQKPFDIHTLADRVCALLYPNETS